MNIMVDIDVDDITTYAGIVDLINQTSFGGDTSNLTYEAVSAGEDLAKIPSNTTMMITYDVTLLQQILFVILGVFIVFINALVVATSGLIIKRGVEPRSMYMLLGNLALIDMVIGIVGILVAIFAKQLASLNSIGCAMQIAIYNSNMVVTVYTVTLIAIDRYLYIIHGIRYNQLVYPKRVRLMIAITWIFGFTIGLLPAFGWSNEWSEKQMCLYIEFVPKSLIVTMAVIVTAPIPIISILYGIILMKAINKIGQSGTESSLKVSTAKDSSKLRSFKGGSVTSISAVVSESTSGYSTGNNIGSSTNNSISSGTGSNIKINPRFSSNAKKWKACKIVYFTTGGYIITWVPACVVSVLLAFCDEKATPEKCESIKSVSVYLSALSFFNCFLNPIIYAWWHNGFRKAAKRIYNRKKEGLVEWYRRLNSRR